jgi:hypothetical protein
LVSRSFQAGYGSTKSDDSPDKEVSVRAQHILHGRRGERYHRKKEDAMRGKRRKIGAPVLSTAKASHG